MIFSGRQYLALSRVYSEMFAPIPPDVARKAAENGQAPALMEALFQAVEYGEAIQDWTPYVQPSPEFSEPALTAA